jgi:perosamine synthetase
MLINKTIPQMEPWFGDEEKMAINNYMDEGGWLTEFKHTQKIL